MASIAPEVSAVAKENPFPEQTASVLLFGRIASVVGIPIRSKRVISARREIPHV